MDGFGSADNIIVIGATNLANSLDPAIKRPGRFDRTISIPLPRRQRKRINTKLLQKKGQN